MYDYGHANASHCPKTSGGDTTIVNGDEMETLYRTTQHIPVRVEGKQEPEAHR